MHKAHFWGVVRTLILVLSTITTDHLASQEEDTSWEVARHIVISISGEATIHRHTWANATVYAPLVLGDWVNSADIIQPIGAAKVEVACENGDIVVIRGVETSPSCNKPIGDTPPPPSNERGIPDESSVRIEVLAPRGLILTAMPSFVWTRHPDAVAYTIRISQGDRDVWVKANLEGPSAQYPEEQELSGGGYNIEVFPQTVRVSEDAQTDRGYIPDASGSAAFVVVSESVREDVLQRIEQRRAFQISDDWFLYLKSTVLAENFLYADAIDTLEHALQINARSGRMLQSPLPPSDTLQGSPIPYLLLGDWYERLELYAPARLTFGDALRLAEQIEHYESLAHINFRLARYERDPIDRYCRLERAARYFESVDDRSGLAMRIEENRAAEEAQFRLGSPPPTCP